MLTLIGRDNASNCFGGILSGGPIGLSSRLRFFFLSIFARSSDRRLDDDDELLPTLPLDVRFSLLLLLLLPLLLMVELIGVIVMEDLMFGTGLLEMGMISMPKRFSNPVKTEFSSADAVLVDCGPIGVMLSDCDSFVSSNLSSDFLNFFRMVKPPE